MVSVLGSSPPSSRWHPAGGLWGMNGVFTDGNDAANGGGGSCYRREWEELMNGWTNKRGWDPGCEGEAGLGQDPGQLLRVISDWFRMAVEGANLTLVSEFLFLGFSEDPKQRQLLLVLFPSMYLVTELGNLLIILAIAIDVQLPCTSSWPTWTLWTFASPPPPSARCWPITCQDTKGFLRLAAWPRCSSSCGSPTSAAYCWLPWPTTAMWPSVTLCTMPRLWYHSSVASWWQHPVLQPLGMPWPTRYSWPASHSAPTTRSPISSVTSALWWSLHALTPFSTMQWCTPWAPCPSSPPLWASWCPTCTSLLLHWGSRPPEASGRPSPPVALISLWCPCSTAHSSGFISAPRPPIRPRRTQPLQWCTPWSLPCWTPSSTVYATTTWRVPWGPSSAGGQFLFGDHSIGMSVQIQRPSVLNFRAQSQS